MLKFKLKSFSSLKKFYFFETFSFQDGAQIEKHLSWRLAPTLKVQEGRRSDREETQTQRCGRKRGEKDIKKRIGDKGFEVAIKRDKRMREKYQQTREGDGAQHRLIRKKQMKEFDKV